MKKYAFTFGYGHVNKRGYSLQNTYVVIEAATEHAAREVMFSVRNASWSFCYPFNVFEPQIEKYRLREITLEECA